MGKLDKKWLSQQQIRNAIGNASAAPYKHSTTWLVALQAMSADQPAEADTKLIRKNTTQACYTKFMHWAISAHANTELLRAKSKANIQANRIVQSCHAELLVRLDRFSYTLSETVVSILTITLKTDVRRTTVEVK